MEQMTFKLSSTFTVNTLIVSKRSEVCSFTMSVAVPGCGDKGMRRTKLPALQHLKVWGGEGCEVAAHAVGQ